MEIKKETFPTPGTYAEYLSLCDLRGVKPMFDSTQFSQVNGDPKPIEDLLQCSKQELMNMIEYSFHVEDLTGSRLKDFVVAFSEIGLKIGFSVNRTCVTSVKVEIDFTGKYLLEFFDKNRLIRTDSFNSPQSRFLPEDGVVWDVNEIFLHVTYLAENGGIQTAYINFADELRGITPLNHVVKNFDF